MGSFYCLNIKVMRLLWITNQKTKKNHFFICNVMRQ